MATFELSRSTRIDADPARVHALVDDFHAWQQWSPWEDLDPDQSRSYSGPDRGVGAHYEWSGNRKAGAGSMEITESRPDAVVIDLRFTKPFKAENVTRFDLAPAGTGTDVTWTLSGERNAVMQLMGKLYFDNAVGKDFEKGLSQLKAAAESPGA
ncbi:SRPBCC family protein [Nocardioides coralli]|uniref:SRPBCC family protein n=1 Tax=Nocardioides coralli TaxID=2872154 RepID=UPI001CA3FD32|nr:SRPBCC family protein [Nocardioides coralli]QZY28230.1 SRPBCC family protein [Nocardioides coralli]